MTPTARAFHGLFLVAGLVFLCVGLYLGITGNADPGVSVRDIEEAEAGAPSDSERMSQLHRSGVRIAVLQGTKWRCKESIASGFDCESETAELDLPQRTDLPVVVTLVGLGLLVASASMAAGSARGRSAAQPAADDR